MVCLIPVFGKHLCVLCVLIYICIESLDLVTINIKFSDHLNSAGLEKQPAQSLTLFAFLSVTFSDVLNGGRMQAVESIRQATQILGTYFHGHLVMETFLWQISSSSTDSRREVVSYWLKNVN